MTTFDRVKKLADNQKISIVELEEKLGFGKNSLYRWKTSSPASDKLQAVADYFGVSTDYLLGRTDRPTMPNEQEDDELMAFFRINTDNMTDFQKEEFEKEMIKFAEYVKFKFDSDKKE